ncbi:MAG: GDP-mannose 4,6-dehydratase [Planctomycetota bacterium]|nr:GDP-mannose 4,6-dehydratase [Planctomycetota bacterium]
MNSLRGVPVCITGGAGFIGSHLTDALVGVGAKVTVLDDLSTGRIENLDGVKDQIKLVRGSILDDSCRSAALAGNRVVIHLAAYVSAPGSVREPLACHEINTTGTLGILEECQKQGVSRIVFASSAAVYGDSEASPKAESHPILPCSVYAQSKAAGEHMLRVWHHCHGLGAVSLRFFNVFGPRQTAGSAYAAAIAAFADALLNGRSITIFGDGGQTRDFVPVANIVQCLMRAAAYEGEAPGDAFNVGLGESNTILDIARMMASLVGAPRDVAFAPARPGDVRHSCADISRAQHVLGYQPLVSVESGLRDTLSWYQSAIAGARGRSA